MYHYLLEITLEPLNKYFPKKKQIRRTLSVPASTTFHQLHVGIWEAIMWEDIHLYEFIVHDCTEWTKKTERESYGRSARLLSIMEEPYHIGFGTPQEVSTDLTVGSVLEDERYKGKVIEYRWHGHFSHIITVNGKIGGDRMVLIEASGWKPGVNEANPDIKPFTAEDRELVTGELGKIRCGDGEQEHYLLRPITAMDKEVFKKMLAKKVQEHERMFGGSNQDGEASGPAEDDGEGVREVCEDNGLDEDAENQALDTVQQYKGIRNQSSALNRLEEDSIASRKRPLEESTTQSAHVAKQSRAS